MNVLFSLLFIASLLFLTVFSPESFVSTVTTAGNNAIELTLKSVAIYGFWMGLLKIVEALGVSDGLARLLRPITRKLIGDMDEEAERYVTANLSCNMLGLGNMATPLGIKGMHRLCEKKDTVPRSAIAFFAVNATSIQLVPTTVISLRSLAGSETPYDILLPSLIVGVITTALSVLAVKVFIKDKEEGEDKK